MKELPPLLDYLFSELGYEVRTLSPTQGFKIFYIDLSSLKLRLSNRTPILCLDQDTLGSITTFHLLQIIQDVIREKRWGKINTLVLLDGNSKPLLKYTKSPQYRNIVVIGAKEQEEIRRSKRTTGCLIDIISSQIPISLLSPYETTSPVIGSRFFARDWEIAKILGNPDTNHLVLGIRRVGKTSLLREIERIIKNEKGGPFAVYMDCSDFTYPDDYIREVVRRLEPRELPRLEMQKYVFYFPNFLERMQSKAKTRLVFILDEFDKMILSQRGNWELINMLRASSNKGACQYIIAGFREVEREQYLLDSPFYNFAQAIQLPVFTMQQARDLIVTPMENLGVHIKRKEEVVSRIYDETAGQPNLIQYYCMILVRQLDRQGERVISPDNLLDIYKDEGFRRHILSSFMENTLNHEKMVVYSILKRHQNSRGIRNFSMKYIDASLRRNGVTLKQSLIDETCNSLILSGTFYRKGNEFSFASPVFVNMLKQNYDLDYLLTKVKEEEL